jgi:hypothetical protein
MHCSFVLERLVEKFSFPDPDFVKIYRLFHTGTRQERAKLGIHEASSTLSPYLHTVHISQDWLVNGGLRNSPEAPFSQVGEGTPSSLWCRIHIL